jgi:hypothetical protein
MALTDTAIRGTKPGKKPFKIYDREGLFLLVNPGGSKLWRWRYRFDGKEKLMALGEYPLVTLGQARELHLAARKTLASGADPMPIAVSLRERCSTARSSSGSFWRTIWSSWDVRIPVSCICSKGFPASTP